MKKIFKLKQWYSLEEAADRLTLTLDETFNVKDVLQMGIEGHIKLSWYMRHVAAIRVEYKERVIPPLLKLSPKRKEPYVSIGFQEVEGQEYVTVLDGPHHLLLNHSGALSDYLLSHITHTGGELIPLDGFFVQGKEDVIWQVMERFEEEFIEAREQKKTRKLYDKENFFPSGVWPKISELGFQKQDLALFESSLKGKEMNNISTRERQTLYKMIIGMAKDAYGFDPDASRSPFPKDLEGILDGLGISVSDDTIRKKLKEASEFLPRDIQDLNN